MTTLRERITTHPLMKVGGSLPSSYAEWKQMLEFYLNPEHFSEEALIAVIGCAYKVSIWEPNVEEGLRRERFLTLLKIADGYACSWIFQKDDEVSQAPAARSRVAVAAMKVLVENVFGRVFGERKELPATLQDEETIAALMQFFDPFDTNLVESNVPLQSDDEPFTQSLRTFLKGFCKELWQARPLEDGDEPDRYSAKWHFFLRRELVVQARPFVLRVLRHMGKLRMLLSDDFRPFMDAESLALLKKWALGTSYQGDGSKGRPSANIREAIEGKSVEAEVYLLLRLRMKDRAMQLRRRARKEAAEREIQLKNELEAIERRKQELEAREAELRGEQPPA